MADALKPAPPAPAAAPSAGAAASAAAPAALAAALSAGAVTLDELPTLPKTDRLAYRMLTLPNAMRVCLVSDPDTDKAAAAMDVGVGSLLDPPELPGASPAVSLRCRLPAAPPAAQPPPPSFTPSPAAPIPCFCAPPCLSRFRRRRRSPPRPRLLLLPPENQNAAPGLAHFTEHMLFYSSAKYPAEDEYSKFISDNGGARALPFFGGTWGRVWVDLRRVWRARF